MKVTMYMDVPPYVENNMLLMAMNRPPSVGPLPSGWRRFAFQVEIPTKAWDELLPPAQSFDVPEDPAGR